MTSASQRNVTTVGSAGPLSDSFYGTADQGGNVWEWNETLVFSSYRGLRGGSFGKFALYLQSDYGSGGDPTSEWNNIGFRVATVPEPSTLLLGALGIIGLLCWNSRRK